MSTWDRPGVVRPGDERDRAQADFALRTLVFGINELVVELIREIPRRELFTQVRREVKRESIGVVTESLVDMSDEARLKRFFLRSGRHKNRNFTRDLFTSGI